MPATPLKKLVTRVIRLEKTAAGIVASVLFKKKRKKKNKKRRACCCPCRSMCRK